VEDGMTDVEKGETETGIKEETEVDPTVIVIDGSDAVTSDSAKAVTTLFSILMKEFLDQLNKKKSLSAKAKPNAKIAPRKRNHWNMLLMKYKARFTAYL
jgi:hypothetical protein